MEADAARFVSESRDRGIGAAGHHDHVSGPDSSERGAPRPQLIAVH